MNSSPIVFLSVAGLASLLWLPLPKSCSAVAIADSPLLGFQERLTPPNPENGDEFGFATATDGVQLIVGARGEDAVAPNAGSASIFTKDVHNNWNLVVDLFPDAAYSSAEFGRSVAIHDSLAVIGAWRDDERGNEAGAVYFYEKNPAGVWSLTQKLFSSDIDGGDFFGISVAIQNRSVFVGSWEDDDIATDSGAVYEFSKVNGSWTEIQKIKAASPTVGDHFGEHIAVDKGVMAVGSFVSETAWVLEVDDTNQWNEALEVNSSARLGSSVAVEDGIVVVGEVFAEGSSSARVGAVRVFEKNEFGWVQTDTLTASDGDDGDDFGTGVALLNDRLLVASPDDGNGAAYLFERRREVWTEVEKIEAKFLPSDSFREDFGYSVALSDSNIFVGSRLGGQTVTTRGGYVDVHRLRIPEPSTTTLFVVASFLFVVRHPRCQ